MSPSLPSVCIPIFARVRRNLVVALAVFPAATVVADTITVCSSGCDHTSINAAIDAASDGDVIQLSAEIYSEGEVIDTDGKAITLLGVTDSGGIPASILDGSGTHGVLRCYTREGADTIFKNLVIRNGFWIDGGGMEIQGSSPNLDNCKFMNNTSINGGGLNCIYSSPTLTGCTFEGNQATDGGGVYHRGGSLTLTECFFFENEAVMGGGLGIFSGDLTLTDCTFSQNTAGIFGGGLFTQAIDGLALTDCIFTNNSASGYGGGMAVSGVPSLAASLNDCNFIQNTATLNAGGFWNANSGQTTLTGCQFIANEAGDNGGGMMDAAGCNSIQTNCSYTTNSALGLADTARGEGGGLFSLESSPTLTGCTFTSNSASGYGGGVSILGGSDDSGSLPEVIPTLNDCTFSYNSAENGAGIHIESSSSGYARITNLADCTFTGNSASAYGGGVSVIGGSDDSDSLPELIPTLNGCTFSDNSAENGGGMYNFESNAVLTDCTFTNNPASNYGGGMYNYESNAVLTDCAFAGNSARVGGGMSNWYGNTVALSDCTFTDNSGTLGGAIANSTASTSVVDCDFMNNTTVTRAGAIFQDGGNSTTIADCTFTNNSCISGESLPTDRGKGGALYLTNAIESLTNCTFTNNSADYGGAISVGPACGLTATDCTFTNNSANGDGGGVFYEAIINGLSLTGCTFTTNTADVDGGGVYISIQSPLLVDVTLSDCTFMGNSATNGGGVYTNGDYGSQSVVATLSNCTFTNNTADDNGGGMYCIDSTQTLADCTFEDNSCSGSGGGVCYEYSSPTLSDCFFSGNSAIDGGGISTRFSDLALYDSTLSANTAMVFGGGLNNSSTTSVIVGGTTICGNEVDGSATDENQIEGDFIETGFNCITAVCDDTDADGDGIPDGCDDCNDSDGDTICDDEDPCPHWPHDCSADGMTIYVTATDQSIHDALDVVPAGGIVDITSGTFSITSPIEPDGRQVTVRGSVDGAGEPATILDGGHQTRILWCRNNVDDGTVFEHLVLQHGSSDEGGGMFNDQASPTVRNCVFRNNSSSYGAGMYNYQDSHPTVINCTFDGNTASEYGGGMFNEEYSSPILTDCSFTGNVSDEYGGGMANLESCDPELTGCDFVGNHSEYGGGMYNESSCSPDLSSCIFETNTASRDGAGMDNNNECSPVLVDCTFDGNVSDRYSGGMGNDLGSDPQLTRCIFKNNEAHYDGAGMYNYRSSPRLTSCEFVNNVVPEDSGTYGGGMLNYGADPVLQDCRFEGNASYYGGGMCNRDESVPELVGCDFISNHAYVDGGGMANYEGSSPDLADCTFDGNTSAYWSGGMSNEYYSDPSLSNCTFTNNSAPDGGAMWNYDHSNPIMTECTFIGNHATNGAEADPDFGGYGGAILNEENSNPVLFNCTLSSNTAVLGGGGIYNWFSSEPYIRESIVCGNTVGVDGATLENQIEGDGTGSGADVDSASCISESCESCFEDLDGDGLNNELDPYPESSWDNGIEDDGQLWVSPGMDLQGAIDLANAINNDSDPATTDITTINFAPGTYLGGIDLRGLSLTLRPGSSGFMSAPMVTWDAQGASRHLTNVGGSTVENFILINGNDVDGGSIHCEQGSTPTLRNLIITTCMADDRGGAIFCAGGSSVTLESCQIYGNVAGSNGGALFVASSASAVLTDCTICGNSLDQIVGGYSGSANSIAEACSGTVSGGDVPDPNPVPNPDGTQTWYVGNNVQYPVLQTVIDAVSPGDEIVILGGNYVESVMVDVPDVTIRPATSLGALDANGGFQSVVLWNPTEGDFADNDEAVYIGSNTSNTVIGRPSEFTQLANGDMVPTLVPVSGAGVNEEYVADAMLVTICNIAYTDLTSMTRMQRGLAGGVGSALAMNIWSRSIDKVGVRSHDGLATVSHVAIGTQNGFGGGVSLTGADNATSFVGCTITGTRSGGQLNDGSPVHAVYIAGGAPLFSGCTVDQNLGSVDGVILQEGGSGSWIGCSIGGTFGNVSPVSNGTMVIRDGAHPTILDTTFSNNLSRFGTIRFDSSLNGPHQPLLIANTIFDENTTTDGQYGAIAYCTDSVAGRNPLLVLDRVVCSNTGQSAGTESGTEWFETDVVSNYLPRYRVLRDISSNVIGSDTQPSGVAARSGGDDSGMVEVSADLNGDGVVNGQDLAIILGAWSP